MGKLQPRDKELCSSNSSKAYVRYDDIHGRQTLYQRHKEWVYVALANQDKPLDAFGTDARHMRTVTHSFAFTPSPGALAS